jgi:heterodisulfide reductase subunit C/nitrate reductase gamma subunit
MFYTASLYIALAIFVLGLIYQISNWFRYKVGTEAGGMTFSRRVFAAIKGIVSTIFSLKVFVLLKVFFLDVLFQIRTLRESKLRWAMHIALFWGFMLLFLWHGLAPIFTLTLFPDYSATVNPFFFMRNLFGLLVIIGLAIASYRRVIMKLPRLKTNVMDRYVLFIIAVIMISGYLLEGAKIVSYSSYEVMVEDYADVDDDEALEALESYWVKEFKIVSPELKGPFDEEVLEMGLEIHEESCAACHSKPQYAFLSYAVSRAIKPITAAADRANVNGALLFIHYMACFIGLAYLPFSKMFHVFASPVSLLANVVMDPEKSDPANIATRQVMELDACTHCGSCSLRCSVGMAFEEIPNVNILPSEKIAAVKALAKGKALSESELRDIQEGLYLCTNCHKCTVACPVGINLQDLWFNVRETLLEKGYPELLVLSPLSFYRGLKQDKIEGDHYKEPLLRARKAVADACKAIETDETITDAHMDSVFIKNLALSNQGNTFSYCFTCTTCTSACPVVRNYDNPREALGLVPHQIIHAAIVGVGDMIFNSNMLWDCLGCYQCQEQCPQGVCVTDVLYELKNVAMKHVNGKPKKS